MIKSHSIYELPAARGYEHLNKPAAFAEGINREAAISIDDIVLPKNIVESARILIRRGFTDLRNDRGRPFDYIMVELSGGVDSALALAAAVDAVGPKKVVVLHYKQRENPIDTEKDDYVHANMLIEHYGITNVIEADITPLLGLVDTLVQESMGGQYTNQPVEYCDGAVWARVAYARNVEMRLNALSMDTGCLTEDLYGHFTTGNKRGHFGIGEWLLKTEVRKLAQLYGVPQEVTNRPKVSGEVGSTFMSTWGADESVLDPVAIVYLYSDAEKREDIVFELEKLGHSREWVEGAVDMFMTLPATRYNNGESTLKLPYFSDINPNRPLPLENCPFSYRGTFRVYANNFLATLGASRKKAVERWWKSSE